MKKPAKKKVPDLRSIYVRNSAEELSIYVGNSAAADEAYARAEAWAKSPAGTPYGKTGA
jgi:hypothetical protein